MTWILVSIRFQDTDCHAFQATESMMKTWQIRPIGGAWVEVQHYFCDGPRVIHAGWEADIGGPVFAQEPGTTAPLEPGLWNLKRYPTMFEPALLERQVEPHDARL